METLRETLVRLLENSSDKVDSSWVDEMSRQYPYFTVPALLQVKRDNGMSDERRRKLLRRIALNTPSKDVLYSIVEPMAADIADRPTTVRRHPRPMKQSTPSSQTTESRPPARTSCLSASYSTPPPTTPYCSPTKRSTACPCPKKLQATAGRA